MGLFERNTYVVICQGGNTAEGVEELATIFLGVRPEEITSSSAKAILESNAERDRVLSSGKGSVVGVLNGAEKKIPDVVNDLKSTAKEVHIGTTFFDHLG